MDSPKAVAPSGLTAIEIACITAGVPMSGNPEIDAIISVALRLRTATQVLQGYCAHHGIWIAPQSVDEALSHADALLALFEKDKK